MKETFSFDVRVSGGRPAEGEEKVWEELEALWHSILQKIHLHASTLKTSMEGITPSSLFLDYSGGSFQVLVHSTRGPVEQWKTVEEIRDTKLLPLKSGKTSVLSMQALFESL